MSEPIQFKLNPLHLGMLGYNGTIYISLRLVTSYTLVWARLTHVELEVVRKLKDSYHTLQSYNELLSTLRLSAPVTVTGQFSSKDWGVVEDCYGGNVQKAEAWVKKFIEISKNG